MTYSADQVMVAVRSASADLRMTLRKAEEACADSLTPAVELQPETTAPLEPGKGKWDSYHQFLLHFR